MDPHRRHWNQQQQALRACLTQSPEPQAVIQLFFDQHAMVHSALVSHAGLYSFEDEVLAGLDESMIRAIPVKGEHSIAWLIWHMARIEDVTMNVLMAGGQQVFRQDQWANRLNVPFYHTGNLMIPESIIQLSAGVDIAALRSYRQAVGTRTRELVQQLALADLKRKIEHDRLERLLAEGAVSDQATGLLDYWGSLTIAGLLLMPPTRHNFIHLNEASRIRQRLLK